MAIEFRERSIDGQVYRVTQLGAKAGRSLLVRLVKLAGPGVGSFVGGIGRGAAGADATGDSALALGVADALHDFTGRLSEDEFAHICDVLARQTVVVQSAEIELRLIDIFDDHFAGGYDRMLRWLAFALEVNYTSFFAGKSGLLTAPLLKLWKAALALQSRATSTGTSTASPPVSDIPTA